MECNPDAKSKRGDPSGTLDDLNKHVGDNKKFVSQSDAIRTSIRKMLDMMDEIDRRHGRLNE